MPHMASTAHRRLHSAIPWGRWCIAFTLISLALIALTVSSCSRRESSMGAEARNNDREPSLDESEPRLRVALQYGLAYAPLALVEQFDLVEKQLPGTAVEGVKLGNAAAIREAMLANRLDVGFMGIPPFLIGADRGMSWRIFTGLSEAPLALVTLNPNLDSLEDIAPRDRIALPQPGSIQHILLSMAAESAFGDPTRFDNQLVTLAHPDAMTALLAGTEVTAHFASPPYLFEELTNEGSRALIRGSDAFGGRFTFIVGVTANVATTNQAAVLQAFVAAVEEAVKMLDSPTPAVIDRLASLYEISQSTLQGYLAHSELRYTTEITGVQRFADAMSRFGYIEQPMDTAPLIVDMRGEP